MRILLLIIASFLFTGSPASSGIVAGNAGNKTHINNDHKPAGHLEAGHSYIVPTAHITYAGGQVNNDSPQKPFSFGRYLNTGEDIYRYAFIERSFFIQPYYYCKPIGLKLIFPKHYFW